MENPVVLSADTFAGAWREFQTRVPVKLGFIENDQHYGAMIDFMNGLLDVMGGQEEHPISGLLDVVGFFVEEYEERANPVPELQTPLPHQIPMTSGMNGGPESTFLGTAPTAPISVSAPPQGKRPELAVPNGGGYPHSMKRVEIDLPDETFAGLDRESAEVAAELRAAAAAKLYELGRVSQEVAAQIAGVSRSEFLTVLSQHKVSPFQETAEEVLAGAQLLLQP